MDQSKSYHSASRKRTPDQVDSSFPPEKQVEVPIPSIKSTHEQKLDANFGDRINARQLGVQSTERGDSDMSMPSPDSSNARKKSRSNSPFIPSGHSADKTTHQDSFMSYPPKEHLVSKQATNQGSYLASNNECNDGFEGKIDPPFHTDVDNISRMFSTGIEFEVNRQHFTAPTGDASSLHSLRDSDMLYRNTNVVESTTAPAGAPLHEHQYSQAAAGDYLQTSRDRVPPTLDEQAHVGHADDYLQSQYSLGYSGARYGQPSLSSPSYGHPGTSAPYSVMDGYAPGFLAPGAQRSSVMDMYGFDPSAPGSSVMDRYAPPLEDKTTASEGFHNTRTDTQALLAMVGVITDHLRFSLLKRWCRI